VNRPVPKNPWARWALDTLERALRTFAQGFAAVITVDAFTDLTANWNQMILLGLLSGGYSLIMSLAAKPVGADDSASLLPEKTDPPQ
jgi:r1t holin